MNIHTPPTDLSVLEGETSFPLGDGPLSTDPYISSQFFEREKAELFRKNWLLMCREDDLPKSGDFVRIDLKFLQASVILVRGKDKTVRAFHNTCRHRGAALCMDAKGSTKVLTCPFHGWVYGLDGKLLDVALEDHFGSLPPKDKLGLVSINADVWGGFVFINFAGAPKKTLAQAMIGMPQALEDYLGKETWNWSHGFKYEINANWKEVMGVANEGYHVNYLHKRTIEAATAPSDSPVWLLPDGGDVMTRLEVHRPEVGSGAETSQTEVGMIAFGLSDAAFLYSDFEVKGAHDKYPGAVNTHHRPRWSFDSHMVLPNLTLHVWNDQLLVHRIIPIDEHRTAWLYDFFFIEKAPSKFSELFARTYGILYGRDIVSEDTTTLEGMHLSLKSGLLKEFYLNDMETAPRALHERVLEEVGATPQKVK